MVEKQLSAGANFVWIGHNNPGWVVPGKAEPALSYAVYDEFTDESAPHHQVAKDILNAQLRFLSVCRQLKVPVVLPIGYQIQMGLRWDEQHPEELRCKPDGTVIDWGGKSASFYSEKYREDILEYYSWVYKTVVKPFEDLIVLINLADEPFGGDYSKPADRKFRNRHGFGLLEAGEDPEKQRLVGEFQSDMIVDYAAWSAKRWYEICPAIPTTMSFCGFHGREENLMPTVSRLFSRTPKHFEPCFDLYPKDGPFEESIRKQDITALWIFLTQLGGLSRKNNKPLWFWPTGNSWGLGMASPDKGSVSDAVVNMISDVDRIAAAGGIIKGFAIWNFNCNNQGLFDDPHETTYHPEEMFEALSDTFSRVRPIMKMGLEGRIQPLAKFALWAPPEPGFLRLGRTQAAVPGLEKPETCHLDFTAMEAIVAQWTPFCVVDDPEDMPEDCTILIALAQSPEELTEAQRETLKKQPQAGKTLVLHAGLAPLFDASCPGGDWKAVDREWGRFFVADLSRAFRREEAEIFAPLWEVIFGTETLQPVYYYEFLWRDVWYNLNNKVEKFEIDVSLSLDCRHFSRNKNRKLEIGEDFMEVELNHHDVLIIE